MDPGQAGPGPGATAGEGAWKHLFKAKGSNKRQPNPRAYQSMDFERNT